MTGSVVSFADLIKRGVLVVGDGHRAKLNELVGGGPLFLRAGALSDSGFDWAGLDAFHTDLQLDNKRGRIGDVVITTKGNSIGRVGRVPGVAPDFVYSPHLSFWRSVEPEVLDQGYLYYWARSERFSSQLRQLAFGTDMAPYFSLRDQARLQISLPSRRDQQGIAEVLGALDDKIAANSVAKRTALSLAEACWVRASLTGDRMVPLREVARLDYGKALKASERVAGDVMVYGSGGITGSHNIALVDRAGVVLGRKGTVGSTYWASGPHFPIDTTYSVVPLAQLSLEYLYFALKAMRLGEMNSDSAVPGLNRDDAYAQMVRVPSSDGIADFSSLVPDLMRAVDGIEGEVTVLVRARDTLLPLLISRRITIKDAESVVGEVL
ncbi:MAG: restriction endonuclease subunit S [Actinomycetales bacterium]|jgi:type I restriction enzyme S subunit|nr:restriction endonuclease subunit S [Actinomycetales bacterium]